MKPHDLPHGLCSVDPVTAIGIGLGSLVGGMFGGGGGSNTVSSVGAGLAPAAPATPPPAAAPAAAAAPATSPLGVKGVPRPQQSTFIGNAATPPTQSGQKTLLGQ